MPSLVLPTPQYLDDNAIRGGMDLMHFAYRCHMEQLDEELECAGLGRAHYRALYFIGRRPGIVSGHLPKLLDITKQSCGRVTVDLTNRGFIYHREGFEDRRQRLLQLTSEGVALEQRLSRALHLNMDRAYKASGETAVAGFWQVMQNLLSTDGRRAFAALQMPPHHVD